MNLTKDIYIFAYLYSLPLYYGSFTGFNYVGTK